MTDADAALARLVALVDAEHLGAHGAHVRVGAAVAERRWRSDDRENVYSVSKGVCAIAAGVAVDEGVLSLGTTVAEALPAIELGDGVASVTLRRLLTMTSGIDFQWFGAQPVEWPDLATEMLRRPSRGPVFQYSDASTYVAMRMLAARVGDVRDWLMPRLFEPLGIHNPQWHRCPLGFVVAGSGLELRTEELARVGLVLRDGGAWEGRQLVSRAWVDGMHADWVEVDAEGGHPRYGLGVWEGPNGSWRLWGAYGQFVVVDPAHDAVVTLTAHEEEREERLAEVVIEALAG